MIESACLSSYTPAPAASYTLTPKRGRAWKRDLSIHDTWIIWRLVFLPGLIYRGVIISRSQRHRRHRSCITIPGPGAWPPSACHRRQIRPATSSAASAAARTICNFAPLQLSSASPPALENNSGLSSSPPSTRQAQSSHSALRTALRFMYSLYIQLNSFHSLRLPEIVFIYRKSRKKTIIVIIIII